MPRPQVESRSVPLSRDVLTAEIRDRLVREGHPRLLVLCILIVSGGCAFLFSAGTLRAGFDSMGLRYPTAALVGYLVFVLLIRVWIAWRRRGLEVDGAGDLGLDFPSFALDRAVPQLDPFGGGGSGGGGGGAQWDVPAITESSSVPNATGADASLPRGVSFDLDADDLLLLLLAALLAAGGLAAMLYVVYAAPLLLAEVALDAALVSSVYRRLRREDVGHWSTAVLRRTWLPAAAVVCVMVGTGFILQHVFPDARSIGDAARAVLDGGLWRR